MTRLFGLETEYGLYVEGKEVGDLVHEAAQVVRSYPDKWAGPWDYRHEDPRRDARGFRVDRLATNPEDDKIDAHAPRRSTDAETRSDRVLANGARLYNDHGHPEYSTPECSNLFDLVAHDKAGERVVLACARARVGRASQPDTTDESGRDARPTISIYKNNTDHHGMSYGTHENYLVRREVPFEKLIEGLTPFFVTRQIFAGAGKVGGETGAAKGAVFQLSQRAEFFTTEVGVDTLDRRPIINSREEPHANARKWRRLHVIVGDANMSEYATALKVGTTSLVLSLLEQGWQPLITLKHPVQALHHISKDPSRKWEVEVESDRRSGIPARHLNAIDLQRLYLSESRAAFAGESDSVDWVLTEWQSVLDGLDADPWSLDDRVDWVAKEKLLQQYLDSEGIRWDDPILQSLDLEYHNVDPEVGLYYGLEQAGARRRIVTDDDIARAMTQPPSDTRAFVRGLCVARFRDTIQSVTWSRIIAKDGDKRVTIDLSNVIGARVEEINRRASAAKSVSDLSELR